MQIQILVTYTGKYFTKYYKFDLATELPNYNLNKFLKILQF